MALAVQKERGRRVGLQTDSRKTAQVVLAPENHAGQTPVSRADGRGFLHRAVDHATHRRSHRPTLWRAVSSQPHLAAPGGPGVELSEAPNPGSGAGRSRDCPLETIPMAPYKKTLKDVGPIWSSSMNRASCSSPASAEPGPQKLKRPSFGPPAAGPSCRPSRLCPSLPNGIVWSSTFDSIPTTSRPPRFRASLNTCFGICEVPSSSYGTAPRSTRPPRLNDSSLPIRGCTPSDFLATPRNSTRMNSSGANSNAVFAMPCQKTWTTFGNFSNDPYSDCADLKGSSGRASERPTSRGHEFLLFMRKSVVAKLVGSGLAIRHIRTLKNCRT